MVYKKRSVPETKDGDMGLILLIILILLLLGSFPSWRYSRGWGYGPSGILGFILLVILVLILLKVITFI